MNNNLLLKRTMVLSVQLLQGGWHCYVFTFVFYIQYLDFIFCCFSNQSTFWGSPYCLDTAEWVEREEKFLFSPSSQPGE